MAQQSFFRDTPRIPKDAIFALTAQYQADNSPVKVNLGQGAYRDDTGSPWILPSVAEARKRLMDQSLDHEYLPILGLHDFRQAVCRLVLGSENFTSMADRVATGQSLSGTGGLHLLAALIKASSSLKAKVWIPEPTWSNHHLLLESLGFECRTFKYYDHTRKRIDMDAYRKMLHRAEPSSIVVLHACAHNPTGCDPSPEQWREIGVTMRQRQLFPFFDAAYLGFNSGDIDRDAFPIRLFVNELQMEAAVSISFAKNMGLYGERVGCSLLVTNSPTVAQNVESMMERLQRAEVSNPPAFGAKVASIILNDNDLTKMWYADLVTMCSRIREMRESLYSLLVANGAPGDWTHITNQSGMFSFLGLPRDIVMRLKDDYHIYMAENSRISLAGLNKSNVAYVAQSISDVLTGQKTTRHQQGPVASRVRSVL